jgi:hypothetical protein
VLALQTLGAGDALGWSWLFPPYPWRFNASALELAPTKCDDDHSLGYEIVKRFAQVIIRRLQASQLPPMLYLWSRFANDMTTLSFGTHKAGCWHNMMTPCGPQLMRFAAA